MRKDLFINSRQVLKNTWDIKNLKEQIEKGGSLSDDVVFTVRLQDFYYTNEGSESLYEWLQEKADALGYKLEDKTVTYIDNGLVDVVTKSGKLLSRIIYFRRLKDYLIDSEDFGNFMDNDAKSSIIAGEGQIYFDYKGCSFIVNGQTITDANEFYSLVVDELGFAKNDFDMISVFVIDSSVN